MSYPPPKIISVSDNVIRIAHPEPIEPSTYLTASVSATGTTITVKDNDWLSNTDPQDLLLFEGFGMSAGEIKKVNGAVTSGTSITVAALTYGHAIDCMVSRVLYDQVEISGSSTATGSKTTIDTVYVDVSGKWTDYVVKGTAYSYYHARFKNSQATTPYYSAYSAAVASTGFASGILGYVAALAVSDLGEDMPDEQWIYDHIYRCENDVAKRLKRWSWLISNDYDLGNATTGDISVALPSDIEDKNTVKSVLGFRIGTGVNLSYMTNHEYETQLEGVAKTTIATTAAIGATSVILTDSRDFDDSGSFEVQGTAYAYTTNTRATNTLSGITALTAELTAGLNAVQNWDDGEPLAYAVKDGYLYFDVPLDSDFNGMNYWLDYNRKPTKNDSLGDSLLIPNDEIYVRWLKKAMLEKRNGEPLRIDHPAKLEYEEKVAQLIDNEITGTGMRLVPRELNSRGRMNTGYWVR